MNSQPDTDTGTRPATSTGAHHDRTPTTRPGSDSRTLSDRHHRGRNGAPALLLDAAGRIPKELTAFEKRWRSSNGNGGVQKRFDALRQRQALALEEKIDLARQRIREWYEAFNGAVAVSYSGGVDSEVLLHLVRELYPDAPALFVNTGLEYPEIRAQVARTGNCATYRPRKPFHKVIQDHGWPMISKKTARGVHVLRNPTDRNQNISRLYREGVNRFGEKVTGFQLAKRWRFLVDAPFACSDRCCDILKKEPAHRYSRDTGRAQFVGTLAAESKAREKVYLQTGCNAYDAKHPRSAPLSFWTDQDILHYLRQTRLPYAAVYGDIIGTETGLRFSGVQSTGCIYCGFGLHMEGQPNRFQLLKNTHPDLWRYCMHRLGLADVLAYIRAHCPDQRIAQKFTGE